MKITLVTKPTVEPVTLAEARSHLRLDTDGSPPTHPDDDLVTNLITTAREYAEDFSRRAFCQQTWDLFLDRFPAGNDIELPKPPLISVTSLTYTTSDGTEETLTENTDFVVDTDSFFGRVVLEYNKTWPTNTLHPKNPIKIRFVAGYASTSSPSDYRENVPRKYKQGILLIVGHHYNHREDSLPGTTIKKIPLNAEDLLSLDRPLNI